ncbi:MAG: 3',5'-cyclic-AMP phosphodiesterase [Coleofasciculus sp. S288]|nr:3',5'-cyclic-AMP phosphodiesterase [Coleofasciculus sp. S288]
MSQVSPLLIAQVTDIHLFANPSKDLLGLPTVKSFHTVLEHLQELLPQPDLLLLTGDLSQDGKLKSYECLQNWLTPLGIPTYWLPGNHDQPTVMEQVLNQAPIFPQKSFQAGGWQFLLLNSAVCGCVHGHLSPESLDWLDCQLQRTGEQPTLISLHHPPLLVNSKWLDRSTLQNSEELLKVIDRYPQVRLVVFGHIHQELERKRRGVRYLGTPSTCIQFMPESTEFGLDTSDPGFRLINLYPDGTFKTRVERVAFTHQLDMAATGY